MVTTLTLQDALIFSDGSIRYRKATTLRDGVEVPVGDLDSECRFDVQARVLFPGTVTRTEFRVSTPTGSNIVTNDQQADYFLFGDSILNFSQSQVFLGDYTVTAIPYYLDSADNEAAGTSKTVTFTISGFGSDSPSAFRARNVRIVDTQQDSLIESLEDGDVIQLASNQPVTVLVNVPSPPSTTVVFALDGPNPDGQVDVLTEENLIPFALFKDSGYEGEPNGRPLAAGNYELRIRLFSERNQGGFGGVEDTIRFTIANEAAEPTALAYPVPFTNELNLRTKVNVTNAHIQLIHSHGQVYKISPDRVTPTEGGLRIDVTSLPAGPYTIRLQDIDRVQTFRGSKE